jgi:hypothetical protein
MDQNTSSLSRPVASRGGAAAGPGGPSAWPDAHHLQHWVDGGATSLGNLVLLCRTHHLAVHEGGWQLARDPASGRVVLAPPAWGQPRGQPQGHDPPAA